jgi:hypothetical protein
VYLSTLQNPGVLITIRDSTGFASVNSSIHVSTTFGVSFFDSYYNPGGYKITQPYGYLTLTPRTSNVWALVNSFAFPENVSLNVSNANAQQIYASSIYQVGGFLSSQQSYFSSIAINKTTASYNIDVDGTINASSFYINGQPFVADGNISSLNTSTINVNGQINFVSGASIFPMSNYGGGVDIMDLLYVASTSNVGIRTNTPQFPLDVNGTIYGLSSIASTAIVNNTLTASSIRGLETQISSVTGSTITSLAATTPLTVNTFVTLSNARAPSIWVAGGISTGNPAVQTLLFSSNNGSNWNAASSGGFVTSAGSNGCKGIAYNGTTWVAVGQGANGPAFIQYSTDGSNWINTTNTFPSGTGNYPTCVGWNGRVWLAGALSAEGVGASNIQISSNGINWSAITAANFTQFTNGLAWNGRFWVGVGAGGTAAASIEYSLNNGSNWSNSTSGGFTTAGNGVAWNGQVFVAVGQDSTAAASIKYSYDGSNWSNSSAGGFSTAGYGIAWNGRIWVAVGNGGSTAASIKYSFDGINWSNSVTGGFTTDGRAVSWSGSRWVATGIHSTPASNIQVSSDGINWSAPTAGNFGTSGGAVAFSSNVSADLQMDNLSFYGKSQYPFTLSTNTIYMADSTLQINNVMTIQNPGVFGSNVGINTTNPSFTLDVVGNTEIIQRTTQPLYVAVGMTSGTSNIQYSYNGITWSNALSGLFSSRGTGVNYNGRMWVATGDNGAAIGSIKYSMDGLNWSNNVTGGFGSGGYGQNVVWNGSYWLAGGATATAAAAIQISYDGINWSNSSNSSLTNCINLAWNGRMWVAGFNGSGQPALKYSFDGINWSNGTSQISQLGTSIAWNGRYWVAAGTSSSSNTTLQWSYDGITWSNAVSGGFATSGNGVAWNGSYWIAGGQSGSATSNIKISYDGSNWSNITSGGFSSSGEKPFWDGVKWIIGGNNGGTSGTIQYSFDGLNWSNATAPGFATYTGGIAYSLSPLPNARFTNLNIQTQNVPQFIESTNTIFAQPSSLTFNNVLTVQNPIVSRTSSNVGIQNPNPFYTLDVNGITNTSSFITNLVRTPNTSSNVWVAGGGNTATNNLRYSLDNGSNWIACTNTATGNTTFTSLNELLAIGYNGQYFLTCGRTSGFSLLAYKSFDGINWTPQTFSGTFPNQYIDEIIWTGTSWVANGKNNTNSNGYIARSSDGINWSGTSSGNFPNPAGTTYGLGLAFNGRRMVAMNTTTNGGQVSWILKYSDDGGANWTNCTVSDPFNVSMYVGGIATNGRIFVAVGYGNTASAHIKYSFDGITFTNALTSVSFSFGSDVCWNGTVFVATGIGGTTIMYSYDGINWSNATNPFTNYGSSVRWSGTHFIAVGVDGTAANQVKISRDGITWTNSSTGLGLSYVLAVGYSSNVVPDLRIDNVAVYGKAQYPYTTSTNMVHLGTSSLTFNSLLTVQNPILGGNNVGINTANPEAALHVNGYGINSLLTLQNTSVDGRLFQIAQAAGPGQFDILASTGDYVIRTQSTINKLFITNGPTAPGLCLSNGYVGIGTAAPATLLDIQSTIGFAGLSSNPFPAQMRIGSLQQRLYLGSYFTGGIGSGSAIQASDFFSGVDHGNSLLLNPIGGLVGILTSTPTQTLDVNGVMRATGGLLLKGGNTLLADWAMNIISTNTTSQAIIMGYSNNTNNAMDLHYYYTGNGSGTNRVALGHYDNGDIFNVMASGRVGISTTAPVTKLDINGGSVSNADSFAVLRAYANSANAKTCMNNVGSACSLWPLPGGPSLYFYWRHSDGNSYTTTITGSSFFTGQHACVVDSNAINSTNLTEHVGLIVSSADKGCISFDISGNRKRGKDAIWITESLPIIKLTDKDKDKAVFGVVTHHANEQYDTDGKPILDYNGVWGDRLNNRIRVNGLGEGAIWVTNINGNIENGDYICSSSIPGYGRKQDDDLLHNYTVAKTTMSCTFELYTDKYKCEEFIVNGTKYRKAFIACTYHCS